MLVGCPAVHAGIVSAAGIEVVVRAIKSAPDDHFSYRSTPPCDQSRASGALVMLVAVQPVRLRIISAAGVEVGNCRSRPPQTIISLPVHTAV